MRFFICFLIVSLFSRTWSQNFSDFEKRLASEGPSERQNIIPLRDSLLKSLLSKDAEAVSREMKMLQTRETEEILPLTDDEKFIAFVYMEQYDSLLVFYVNNAKNAYREIFASKKTMQDVIADDALHAFLLDFESRNESRLKKENILTATQNAAIDPVYKAEAAAVYLIPNLYKEKRARQNFIQNAYAFIEKYPDHPDADWLKKSVLAPLTDNRDYVKFADSVRHCGLMADRERAAQDRQELLNKKLYTSGLGASFLLGVGVPMTGRLKRFYSDEFNSPFSGMFIVEIPVLQLWRFELALDASGPMNEGAGIFGFDLGFVVLDKPQYKITPYLSIGATSVYEESKDSVLTGGDSFESYSAGVNFDYRFATHKFFSKRILMTYSIRVKYQFSYASTRIQWESNGITGEAETYKGIYHTLAAGVNIFIW